MVVLIVPRSASILTAPLKMVAGCGSDASEARLAGRVFLREICADFLLGDRHHAVRLWVAATSHAGSNIHGRSHGRERSSAAPVVPLVVGRVIVTATITTTLRFRGFLLISTVSVSVSISLPMPIITTTIASATHVGSGGGWWIIGRRLIVPGLSQDGRLQASPGNVIL